MPELPEVETSRRGIEPHILNRKITEVIIRQHQLRWPIPESLPLLVKGKTLSAVSRRGKYLLLEFSKHGCIIIHLGMSGSLRICSQQQRPEKHDHVDFVFGKTILRLRDPRKFGCVLWAEPPFESHRLLSNMGPEPLTETFDADHLYLISRKRTCTIKSFIMNSHNVVGVGNIYACESLFLAGINPKRKAGTLSRERCRRLCDAIKQILSAAIEQGGTTLRDFTREDGQPGYFAQQLHVYGLVGKPCTICHHSIKQITQQQRSTYYCTKCQK